MGQKLGKYARGAYDAIVYIEGSEVVAEDSQGRKIASGVAGTDDVSVIQAGIDHEGYYTGTDYPRSIYIGKGNYVIGSTIDCTRYINYNRKFQLNMHKGAVLTAATSGAPVLDFTGMKGATITGGYIIGSGTNSPSIGVLFARAADLDSAGEHYISDLRTSGFFTHAAIYNLGSEVNSIYHSRISNSNAGGYGIKICRDNTDAITSPKSTPSGGSTMAGFWISDITIVANGGGNCSSVFIGNGDCRDISITDGFMYSNGRAKVEFSYPGNAMNGIYRVENIHSEGASSSVIYADCTMYRLLAGNLSDYDATANELHFTGGLYYSNFKRPFYFDGNKMLYSGGNVLYTTIEGNPNGIVYVTAAGGKINGSFIEIDAIANVTATYLPGTVIRSNSHSAASLYSLGSRTMFGISTSASEYFDKTIAGGIITAEQSWTRIYTEGGAASDDLDTINGGTSGVIMIVSPKTDAKVVVLKHGTGNIFLANSADVSLSLTTDYVMMISDGTNWHELSRNISSKQKSSGSSTGTGSEQTIAHGLAAIPTGCKAWIKIEYPVGSGRYITKDIPFDATNVYPTVDNGVAFEWGIA